jgi:serine/threonine protein kinase
VYIQVTWHAGMRCVSLRGDVVECLLLSHPDLQSNTAESALQAEKPSAKDMDLFLKEVRTLAKLHHRNIVQFYGASLDPGSSMFFVTELMKGGDLYSALRHHPETMRWDKLGKKVALDVALGINYLHTRRPPLLHRDLKSPNVLLSEEGVAKIADVGMVRSQVKDLVTAQPVMTPLWAAPEVSSTHFALAFRC